MPLKLLLTARIAGNLLAAFVFGASGACKSSVSRAEVAPAASPSSAAGQAFKTAYNEWGRGNQAGAEALLETAVQKYPQSQSLAFFRAACVRSRFDIASAGTLFAAASRLNPSSAYGQSADVLRLLDAGIEVPAGFDLLRDLVRRNSGDALLLWMLAVQCRQHHRSAEGVQHYAKLLKKVPVGSVLIHQTYANLLDEQKRHNDALKHRFLAVKLEPAGWSYDGLANTLDRLGRYADASKVHAQATAIAPNRPSYWYNWASTLYNQGSYKESVLKCREALRLNPGDAASWNLMGCCLEKSGLASDALLLYQRAAALDPADALYRKNAAACLAALKKSSRSAP